MNNFDGLYGNNGFVGVYTKKTGCGKVTVWEPVGDLIHPETNDMEVDESFPFPTGEHFGRTLSLSNDGAILAIGARGNNDGGENAGHVRISLNKDRILW
ncbi:hypothetical protein QQ020_01635 [Fulvivirgaceae bacterium BMA12]|uniref:Uncharacterized protein n=1 Tax=Agaribacillus aureus TaxID=3051825 RepID=A0ABT8KZ49_9BACT|nr:hypothetical protein [Fulvivirgaceae bacterium BMA12]